MDYLVRNYGAIGDGIKNDTKAIQAAIDDCYKNGGGNVVLDGGLVYRSGILVLHDNINIHLTKDTLLKASDNLNEFNKDGIDYGDKMVLGPTYENCDYSGQPNKFFIYAKGCKNISITGLGRIDGNEKIFYGKTTKWHIEGSFYPRVPMIFFEDCCNITIKNITLQNSGFWTTHLVGCNQIIIDSVTILNNLRLANCDGIDPDHCKNVKINNCYIEAADDCIVFKNTEGGRKYGPTENIEVSNCTLMSTSAAIKFGTESVDDFRNIRITDCKIIKSNRGIALQLRDEGSIYDVTFDNIEIETRRFSVEHWWGKAEPVSITAVKRKEECKVGNIYNIKFNKIKADSENGIFIYGDESINIYDIEFNDLDLVIRRKTDWPMGVYDLRPSEKYRIIEEPTKVLYKENTSNIVFKKFKFKVDESIENNE